MDVRLVFAVFPLFFIATMAEGVTFWRETVTLTCPENGIWFVNGQKNDSYSKEFEFTYDGKIKPQSYCEYPEDSDTPKKRYNFYVKGKVCPHCFELDGHLFGLIIIGDVIGTAMLMMVIYKCAKKKASAGPAHPKAPSRSSAPPQTPSRDYEQLNIHTRSQDTYSIVNRTG